MDVKRAYCELILALGIRYPWQPINMAADWEAEAEDGSFQSVADGNFVRTSESRRVKFICLFKQKNK
ncbi:hypothetical protein CHUAL_001178 [Chamberlinius hualienensis]